MAGTTPRTGDPATDQRLAASLLASSKDRAEHQITIDTVLDAVLPFCSYVDSEPEPSIVTRPRPTARSGVTEVTTGATGPVYRDPGPSLRDPRERGTWGWSLGLST